MAIQAGAVRAKQRPFAVMETLAGAAAAVQHALEIARQAGKDSLPSPRGLQKTNLRLDSADVNALEKHLLQSLM